ncbi:MAG: hypothetical protein V4773_05810 [Verrucomicrobiota bacterium]
MKLQDPKNETQRMLKTLPAHADWDDLMYQIYVRKKNAAGLRDSAAGRVVTSPQIRRSLRVGVGAPATPRKLVRSRRAAYESGESATLTMDQLAKAIRRR